MLTDYVVILDNRAAKALAAFLKVDQKLLQDIFQVIPLCLRHRLRKDPLETIDSGEKCKTCLKKVLVKTYKAK
jgi:magnesium chelatase subunit I